MFVMEPTQDLFSFSSKVVVLKYVSLPATRDVDTRSGFSVSINHYSDFDLRYRGLKVGSKVCETEFGKVSFYGQLIDYRDSVGL